MVTLSDGKNERTLGWQDDGWHYTIQTARPCNQDALVVTILRHQPRGEGHHQQYLTDEGWEDYQAFDLLRSTLAFPGNCLYDTDKVDRLVLDATERALEAAASKGSL